MKNLVSKTSLHLLLLLSYFFIRFLFSLYLPYGIVDSFSHIYGIIDLAAIIIFIVFTFLLFTKKPSKLASVLTYAIFYFLLFVLTLSFSASMKNFTKNKWAKHPEARYLMIDSYLKKNDPLGNNLDYLEFTLGPVDVIGYIRYRLPEEVSRSDSSLAEKKAYIYKNLQKDYLTKVVLAFIIDDYSNITEIKIYEDKQIEIY